jgi:hypothetical protein
MSKFIGTLFAFIIVAILTGLFGEARKIYATKPKRVKNRIIAIISFLIAIVFTILVHWVIQERERVRPAREALERQLGE